MILYIRWWDTKIKQTGKKERRGIRKRKTLLPLVISFQNRNNLETSFQYYYNIELYILFTKQVLYK
jgi:hypothetical protein